jgi:hypothetical protein
MNDPQQCDSKNDKKILNKALKDTLNPKDK